MRRRIHAGVEDPGRRSANRNWKNRESVPPSLRLGGRCVACVLEKNNAIHSSLTRMCGNRRGRTRETSSGSSRGQKTEHNTRWWWKREQKTFLLGFRNPERKGLSNFSSSVYNQHISDSTFFLTPLNDIIESITYDNHHEKITALGALERLRLFINHTYWEQRFVFQCLMF